MIIESTDRPALIVVDLQRVTIGNARASSEPDWLARATAVADAFRARGLPVVSATSVGTPQGRTTYAASGRDWPGDALPLVPEAAQGTHDIAVARRGLSVFAGTDLADRLRSEGVTTVVLVGIATSFGVESSARQAYDLGFSVVVVSDATADLTADAHAHALTSVFPVIGQVGTAQQVTTAIQTVRNEEIPG